LRMGKVGVSDYLQKTSGDIAFIEVAKAGSIVEKGKETRNGGKRKDDHRSALPAF
jgi:glycine cleavage system H lipoate-binding protein